MALLPVIGPRIGGLPGVDSPAPQQWTQAQSAAFRESAIVYQVTTGAVSAKTYGPTVGANLLNTVGPVFSAAPVSINSTAAITSGNITITGVTTAGAPAATYYVFTSYTATSQESLQGNEFLVNCAAGFTFSVNVASAGSPASSTNFAVYVSLYEGSELLQQATKTTTALGSAFTVPFPLTNSVGINAAPSNTTTNIVGIAMADSQALWATGVGGSFTAGGINQMLGTWMPPTPLGPIYPQQSNVVSLQNGQPFEITLLTTPWTNALIGQQVALTLDGSGYHGVSFTGSNAFAYIQSKTTGSPADVGGVGDVNVRVNCVALSTVVI